MLQVQKIGQWASNPKSARLDGRTVYPLYLPFYISPVIPIPIPMGLSSYGQFVSTGTFTTNPGSAVSFTSSSTSGMTLATATDIRIGNAGDYLVITTIDWEHVGGGVAHKGRQWINLNGSDVPLSCVETTINGGGTNQVPLTNQWLLTNLSPTNIIQVWYATSDTTTLPTNQSAVTTAPIPSSWQINSPACPAVSVVVLQLSP